MTDWARRCWCGADALRPFGGDYLQCAECRTLVSQNGLSGEETLVSDDVLAYYGKRYWLEHQTEDLLLPDIHARVRLDLPERCVDWLTLLLEYSTPPARVLEIGAGHGAYTALLRWAGYDATALDLSPWVADFAQSRFDIPYLVGRVEDQDIDPCSFDVVVANDVLEHLSTPEQTVRAWATLLKPSGILVLQTPEYPGGSYAELENEGALFLKHLDASTEHLYLFGRPALELLLRRVGLSHVRFDPPVYPYDMTCAASASVLPDTGGVDPAEVVARVGATGPLVLALVDARRLVKQIDADRQARLEVIEQLDEALAEATRDRDSTEIREEPSSDGEADESMAERREEQVGDP